MFSMFLCFGSKKDVVHVFLMALGYVLFKKNSCSSLTTPLCKKQHKEVISELKIGPKRVYFPLDAQL